MSPSQEAMEGYLYYAEEDEKLALDFEAKIHQTIQQIRRDPIR